MDALLRFVCCVPKSEKVRNKADRLEHLSLGVKREDLLEIREMECSRRRSKEFPIVFNKNNPEIAELSEKAEERQKVADKLYSAYTQEQQKREAQSLVDVWKLARAKLGKGAVRPNIDSKAASLKLGRAWRATAAKRRAERAAMSVEQRNRLAAIESRKEAEEEPESEYAAMAAARWRQMIERKREGRLRNPPRIGQGG